jgi:cob(I)alamin adenosyltransferase
MEVTLTDEERRMFSNRLRERDTEIEWLRAALEETVVAIVHVQKHLIHGSSPQDAVMNGALAIARRALEPKP